MLNLCDESSFADIDVLEELIDSISLGLIEY